MKLKTLRSYLECLSFLFWIVFTILSISLAGLGLEGILLAVLLVMTSSTQPIHFPLTMTCLGALGVIFSICWRQLGIDFFHYLDYDSPNFADDEEESPSTILKDLILEVEASSGYARNDARLKAKTWLISHASDLGEEDVLLARTHFGYLLPAHWGL